jgi:hypothetical protein
VEAARFFFLFSFFFKFFWKKNGANFEPLLGKN